jgi:DNA-binding transcriptional ArsR family regulator|uniref:Transcriptional regulator n=1 Tax=Desulfobacca acetoxidans TaxID=60893 RepID=A0A7C3WMX5_9BACT
MNFSNQGFFKSLEKAARCLKVLAHPTRLLLLQLLGEGERSVQELEILLNVPQPSVSQHLNLLKDRDILESRRVGQQNLYRLKDRQILKLLALARELFCKE